MTNLEIKEEIENLIEENRQISVKDAFTLNKELYQNLKRIEELRKLCTHEYQNGVCIYCRRSENDC